MTLGHRLLPFSLLLALLISIAAPAGASNVAVVRAESLDSVSSDLDRISNPEQTGFSLELLPWLQASLGLPDLSWVDRARPLAVALPVQGMALGAKGLVAVFPVTDAGLAMQNLTEAFENAEPDETGVLEIELEGDATLVIRPLDGLLVVGQNRGLVVGFNPQTALEPGDLPPGNLALEIDLEPIAPMVLMGLQAARQTAEQQIATPNETGKAPDPETTKAIAGIGFQLVQDLLRNTSRIQLSIEVGAEHVIAHHRLIPNGGSTLAGLIGAQQGGLPEIAHYIDAAEADMVMAAQVTYTPAFLEAFQGYLGQYVTVMQELGAMAGKAPETEWVGFAMAMASAGLDKWSDCYRGDLAAAVDWDEGGFSMRQVLGTADAEVCRSMFSEITRATSKLPELDGGPMITITEDALQYRGVSAQRQETRVPQPEETDEATREIMSSWFGGDSVLNYLAVTEDVILATAGPDAEQGFKDLVDRLSGESGGGGLTAAAFTPLRTGPGLFLVFDIGAMLGSFSKLPGAGAAGTLPDLSDGAGRFVYGARFESSALSLELAVPLGFLDAIGKAAGKSSENLERAAVSRP